MNGETLREKFDRRREETRTIKEIEGTSTIHTDLWSYGGDIAREVIAAGVQTGDRLVFEIVNGSMVTGARRANTTEWISHRTTDELVNQHDEMIAGFRQRDQEQLDANREDWTRREAALPEWLRDRLATFHERGGDEFALAGWGYELTICEITVLLLEHDLDDDGPAVMAYAREHGTSGNQHGMALALARAHREDPAMSMAGTVCALSPITGDPDYSKQGDIA